MKKMIFALALLVAVSFTSCKNDATATDALATDSTAVAIDSVKVDTTATSVDTAKVAKDSVK
jgi:outer membrane lipoprotein SlyB